MIAFILTVPIWDSSPAKFCIFRVLGGRKKLWCFLLGKMCKLWAGECTYSSEKLLFHHWWHIIFYQIKSSNKYVPFYLLLIIKDLQNIPKKMLKISLPNNCAWFLCKLKFIRWYDPLSLASYRDRWVDEFPNVLNIGIEGVSLKCMQYQNQMSLPVCAKKYSLMPCRRFKFLSSSKIQSAKKS